MASFPTHFPDAWVARMTPAVEYFLEHRQTHQVIQKYLTFYGAATVLDLTQAQKGAVFSAYQLWEETKRFEKQPAINTAADAVEADFDINFIVS